jgi:hypothetical protein
MVSKIGFSDESVSSCTRIHSICLVNLPIDAVDMVVDSIEEICNRHGVNSLEWKKISGSIKKRTCINEILDTLFEKYIPGVLCIDVLWWSMDDSRHSGVRRIDTNENRFRMFHHLGCNVLTKRSVEGDHWILYPDELTYADWSLIQKTISSKGFDPTIIPTVDGSKDWGTVHYELDGVVETSSDHRLIQLADVIAGITCCYASESDAILASEEKTPSLFGSDATPKISNNKKNGDYPIIKHFISLIKNAKYGLSVSKGYFETHVAHKNKPINVWRWESQHQMDKPPTRPKKLVEGRFPKQSLGST